MTWISATDPLALVAIQAGQVNTPATQTGADAGSKLDTQQRAVQLGEPVPIVFARRRNGKGGVLISPGATEARFENDATNNVTAYYHLVLSEGQIDSIAVKDVFQRSCRVGTHSQTYNRRAGTWAPGNAIVARAGYDMPECPYYCGTVGAYPGMSTLSFSVTIPNGFDQWNRQVHCFIRGGIHVTRLADGVTGPSDNFADLVQYVLKASARVPSPLLDTAALTSAAGFLEANGFTCNCWLTESINYSDLLARWAPYFLLGESNNGGKKGLRPLLPTNTNGTIKTTAITPVYTFNEDIILPDTLEVQYTSLADRQPFVVQAIWRQQLTDDFGIVRTAEVRYSGTAASGPYESHDLSAFCTNETHAVKVGAYILAKRFYTTHTIRFSARPQKHNTLVSPGDIVRVKLQRQSSAAANSNFDYYYQVERITKTLAGDLTYECTHFPVDGQGRSLIALDVAAATGTGVVLTSNKTGVGCDINSSTDDTVPAETWQNADAEVLAAGATNDLIYGGEQDPSDNTSNTNDSLDSQARNQISGTPAVGETLTFDPGCPGYYTEWRLVDDATGNYTVVSSGEAAPYIATETAAATGKSVYAVGTCPDGTTVTSEPVKIESQYANWPACYIKPTDPEWPAELPVATNEGSDPWIEPATGEVDCCEPGMKTTITYSISSAGYWTRSAATNNCSYTTGPFTSAGSTDRVNISNAYLTCIKGVFIVRYPGPTGPSNTYCGSGLVGVQIVAINGSGQLVPIAGTPGFNNPNGSDVTSVTVSTTVQPIP